MKTAEETARDIIIPTAGIAIAWDKAGLSSKDALRQLCEAIEREVIGEDEKTPEFEPDPGGEKGIFTEVGLRNVIKSAQYDWTGHAYRSGLRKEQRAKLRAFCGVGEQPSAVDDEWIDQQIERSEES